MGGLLESNTSTERPPIQQLGTISYTHIYRLPYFELTLLALFRPTLIIPGKKFGLLPLWATFNAIQKCGILKIDKDIIYALLVTGSLNNC